MSEQPEGPTETFGQMIVAARLRRDMSQRALAEAVRRRGEKISQGYISLIERTAGTDKEPDVDYDLVIALAGALRLDRDKALLASGKNPNDPRHMQSGVDTLHVRILMEFDVVGPSGERRAIQTSDLTPELRRQLARMLLEGDLD